MTTPTADVTALLAAAALHPDDDTPRLLLADCLDETEARYVRCPGCKGSKRDDWGRGSGFGHCPRCFDSVAKVSSGEIPDPAVAALKDRAELIRVQVELHREYHGWPQDNGAAKDGKHRELMDRERNLLAKHPEWLVPCPECEGTTRLVCEHCGVDFAGRVGTLERGLLGCVRVPALGTVMRQLRSYEQDSDNPVNLGDWAPTPWASRVFGSPWNRCARVECGDRVPGTTIGGGGYWRSEDDSGVVRPETVLPDFFFRMVGRYHPTPADAALALSLAVGAWLRKNVKLAAAAKEEEK